jgi:two-component sensor histidine kinase
VFGPPVALQSRAALTLGLAFHELMTNAAKHGALAKPGMKLAVSWERRDGVLVITWEESGGRDIKPPPDTGFGMTMLRRALTQELSAKVDTDFTETGLRCVIRIPAKELLTAERKDDEES